MIPNTSALLDVRSSMTPPSCELLFFFLSSLRVRQGVPVTPWGGGMCFLLGFLVNFIQIRRGSVSLPLPSRPRKQRQDRQQHCQV